MVSPCTLGNSSRFPLPGLYSGVVLGSGYSSIAGTMLPFVAAFTLEAFLAWANGNITHTDIHDVKVIELNSVALRLE